MKKILSILFCVAFFTVAYGQIANQTVSVLLTNGEVESFSGGPDISFDGGNIIISGESYSAANVQRLVYGKATGQKFKKCDDNDLPALFIYRNDGKFNAFAREDVRQVVHSGTDTQVVTADSTYTIPSAAIDSIGLHRFATVYAQNVVKLDEYEKYVTQSDSLNITFSNLPKKMKLNEGDILVYEGFSNAFPNGFAGRVNSISESGDYSVVCESVCADDVFQRVLIFSKTSSTEDNQAMAMEGAHDHGPSALAVSFFNKSYDLSSYTFKKTYESNNTICTYTGKITPYVTTTLMKRSPFDEAFFEVAIQSNYSVHANYTIKGKTGVSIKKPEMILKTCDLGISSFKLFFAPCIEPQVEAKVSGHGFCNGTFSVGISGTNSSSVIYKDYKVLNYGHDAEGVMTGNVFIGAGFFAELESKNKFFDFQLNAGLNTGFDIVTDLNVFIPKVPITYSQVENKIVDTNIKVALQAGGYIKMKKIFIYKEEFSDDLLKYLSPIGKYDIVPEFTEPFIKTTKNNVSLSSQASRTIFCDVNIGWEIQRDGVAVRNSPKPLDYPNNYYAVINNDETFNGLDYEVPYIAIPTVTICNKYLLAKPTKYFIIKPEIITGDYSNVETNSAIIEGILPDPDIDCSEYGLRYAPVDTENWKYIKNPDKTIYSDSTAHFKADLTGLMENHVYQYQAYMNFKPVNSNSVKTYYGDVKTFLTKQKELAYQNKVRGPLELRYADPKTLARAAVYGEDVLDDYKVYVAKEVCKYLEGALKIENPDPDGKLAIQIKKTVDERLRTGYCESLVEKKMTKAQLQKLHSLMQSVRDEAGYAKVNNYIASIGLKKDFDEAEERVHLYDGLLTEEEIALKDCNMDSLYRVANSKLEPIQESIYRVSKQIEEVSLDYNESDEEKYNKLVKLYTRYLPLREKVDSLYRSEVLPYYRQKDIHDNVWLKLTAQAPMDYNLGEQHRFTWVYLMSYMGYPAISDNIAGPASDVFDEWNAEHGGDMIDIVKQHYQNESDAQERTWGDYYE